MQMRLKSEDEILDPGVRRKVIEEILGDENRSRKDEHYKRYEIYKDQTYKYVMEKLLQWFDQSTVDEMAYAISNVSIARKIIDKLARVYANGVQRTVPQNEVQTKQIQELARELDFDSVMKKVNRYLKLHKNTALYVKPVPVGEPEDNKYTLKVECLPPFLYDVIEDYYDREKPKVFILSNYIRRDARSAVLHPENHTTQRDLSTRFMSGGNGKDEIIADTPADQGSDYNCFIFWSNKYHFTCNEKGEIISGSEIENPISELPFVNFAMDQDGAFWAMGGDDLTDGAVLVNSMITNVNHIGIMQGYGQFFMKGKNLPRQIKLGPTKAILVEFEKDDPVPEMGFLSANPPLDELRQVIEMYVALILTTNNLSTSGISASLQGSQNAASGIALIIDKAESMEDVNDQSQIFKDKEPEIWELISKWLMLYKSKGLIEDDLSGYKLDQELAVNLKFGDPKPIMSEAEKLANIEKRKELGLNTIPELMMIDDPSMTQEEAQAKMGQVMADKAMQLSQMMIVGNSNADQGDQESGVQQQDNLNS